MVSLLKCGHSSVLLYSFRDLDGVRKKFCMGCVLEKSGVKELDGKELIKKKSDYDKKVEMITAKPVDEQEKIESKDDEEKLVLEPIKEKSVLPKMK